MRINRRWFLAGACLLILPVVFTVYAKDDREEGKFRWDIVHLTPPTLGAGGNASALANDLSKITLTGSGRFEVGDDDEVKGGGMWTTFSPKGVETGHGTYRVTRLIRFELAPGTLVGTGLIDNIADIETAHAGLAAFAIRYSDGARGVLFVSCSLVGTPPSVFEGVTASKGFVDYWSRVAPVAGVDSNRTAFHSLTNEEEDRAGN